MKKKKTLSEILSLVLGAVMIFSVAAPVLAVNATKETEEAAVIRRWSWVDTEKILTGDANNGYLLAAAGDYSKEAPLSRDELASHLPGSITAEIVKPTQPAETAPDITTTSNTAPSTTTTSDTAPETETVTLAVTWDLSAVPQEGVYTGSYVLNAALPAGYVLADNLPKLTVTLMLDSPYPLIDDTVLKNNQLKTTRPLNTKVNLFDYWVYGDQTTNDWIVQSTLQPPFSAYKEGINNGHPLIIGNGMGSDATRYYYGLWNTTATSWKSQDVYNNYSWIEGIVANRLGADGMPQINTTAVQDRKNVAQTVYDAWDKDPSLGYLFDPSKNVQGRAAYQNVRNLFTLDGGNYRFKSSETYAQFVPDNSVVDSDGYFNVYNTWAVKNSTHAGGNFVPFNTVHQVLKDDGSGKLTDAGLSCTANNVNKNATSAGKTSSDTTINHYLGMTMETSFFQPDGGVIKGGGNDAGEPMIFTFTGDNDVWIFIDGVLVGDMGGVHSESFIGIDFSTGYIYRGPVKNDGSIPSLAEIKDIFAGVGDQEGEIRLSFSPSEKRNYYAPNVAGAKVIFSRTTLKAMHDAANDNTQIWNGFTYEDQTIHTLKFFYMERGGYDANFSLDFNLVSVPHSLITKVDQDGHPVSGVEFELYAADYDQTTGQSTISSYNGGQPICTATTDENGRLMLVDNHHRVIQFSELAQHNVVSYILRETALPLGYRSRTEVPLYFENGLVFSRDYFQSGAYTTAILNVTMDKTLYNLDNPDEVLVPDTGNMNGIIFAVPLKLDSHKAGAFDKNDPALSALLHPVAGSFYNGWQVMAEGADIHTPEDKAALITAAKNYNEIAEKNSRNVYALTLDNIPGAVQKQYWYTYTVALSQGLSGDQLKQYVAENTQYIVAFYYAPGISTLDELTADNTIYRILDTSFEKEFTSDLHIPNTFNRFRVQKMDYHGDWVEGALFGLYQLYGEHDRDGDGDGYLAVSVYGKKYYLNTEMFNLSAQDLADIKAGAASGNPVDVLKTGSGGIPIHRKQKTYAELKADYDKGEGNRTITLWDWNTTKDHTRISNLVLNGTAMFPSAYDGQNFGSMDFYDESNTRTYLEIGYYVLAELKAPVHHIINENLTPVEVTDESIYADAGDQNNGIRVGKYVGFPVSSMTRFAAEDAIDGTLTYLKTQMKIVSGQPLSNGQWENTDKNTSEGLVTYHYKYDNRLGHYQRMLNEDNSTIYMKAAPNLYMFTSVGHPVLRVYQENESTRCTISLKDSYRSPAGGNQNGKLILKLVDETGSATRLVVNLTNGTACYRLQAGQRVEEYWFAQYKADGENFEGVYRIYPEDPGSTDAHDFVINHPEVRDCGEKDISHLFSVSTVIQVYDLDKGDTTVQVKVESEKLKEEKPFYFRLYALFDKVTEVMLFDPVTKAVSDYTGYLNVRIGPEGLSVGNSNTGEYDESDTRNISVEFKNGVGKVWLSEGYAIKRVYIPENADHSAHNLVAFVPYQITLTGENANYTGDLYISAENIASKEPLKVHKIAFTNGQGIYYAANSSTITGVSTAADASGYGLTGEQFTFTDTCRYATASADEIFDENPVRKLDVRFHTDNADVKEIITQSSAGAQPDQSMVDVTEENGSYYLTLKASGDVVNTNPFLNGKAITADFALYDGQSITIQNLPCGITYFVQEWSLGQSPEGLQYDENNSAYQLLTDTYTTVTTTSTTETSAPPQSGDPQKQYEYVQQFRTAKSLIRSDLDRTTIFHNYPLLGSLMIYKTVVGHMGDREQPFEFTVTLNDTRINGDYGGVQFTNGVATLQLRHGERAAIPDLPHLIGYTVKETPISGYETTYTQTLRDATGMVTDILQQDAIYTDNGVSGTIDTNALNQVEFINSKDGELDTGIHLDGWPYMTILAVVMAMMIGTIIRHKRRRRCNNKGGENR